MRDYKRIRLIEDKEEIDRLKIGTDTDIISAVRSIESTNCRSVLIVDDNDRLTSVLTDGDVRRWIISSGDLHAPALKAANKNPICLYEADVEAATDYILNKAIMPVPVTDKDNHIVGVFVPQYRGEEAVRPLYGIPVVLMAGGKGTRLYPYTKILPKPLIPIGEIPISEHIVNRFFEEGCDDFYFIVNYKKNMIKAYYNEIEKPYNVMFIEEEKSLGTGGGVSLLKDRVNSTFVLTNCDTIIDDSFENILKEHREKNNLVTMICALRNYEVPYGVVETGDNGSIKSITEKPSMSYLTNTGTYIVEPQVIGHIPEGQSISFPDIIMKLREAGENVGVYPINEDAWLDMGQFNTMDKMKERLNIND